MECVKCGNKIDDYSNAYSYLFSKNENGDFIVDYQLCSECVKKYMYKNYIKINKNRKQKTYTQVQDEKGFYYAQDTFSFYDIYGNKVHYLVKNKEFKEKLKKVIEKKEEELKAFQGKINELYSLIND